ncbi:hypothetical protein K458DRAFT_319262 [Lentithecium fluviatile CBS 122367]|uniref:Uncharacterized protein n=1 Tax=Lentithecium fluviatile CBS 122367 TaxID=1168545 RepID=A0A6G1IHX5_9PLEO|nr:hypothetical protein K458DRAFT_319262 [Lentithecium fluviatile CBS 122367]
MPSPIILPAPLSWSSLAPGQLLVDPLNPTHNSTSGAPSHALNEPLIQSDYEDLLTHDDQGRLISSLIGKPSPDSPNLISLHADQVHYNSLKSPASAFDVLRRSPSTQSYFRQVAPQTQTLYYVTGVQKLKNPTFRKPSTIDTSRTVIPSSDSADIKLPTYERRDSILDMSESSNDAVLGVELRKVRCMLGSPTSPHSIEDIDYAWTYHKVDGDEDLQLAVGLGKALEPAEFRALARIVADEDFSDDGSYESGSEDEGSAGFLC